MNRLKQLNQGSGGGGSTGMDASQIAGQPKQWYIKKKDLQKWGYTNNCSRCRLIMRENMKAHSRVRHSPECRARLEEELRRCGDARVDRAEQRFRLIEGMMKGMKEGKNTLRSTTSGRRGTSGTARRCCKRA